MNKCSNNIFTMCKYQDLIKCTMLNQTLFARFPFEELKLNKANYVNHIDNEARKFGGRYNTIDVMLIGFLSNWS